MTKSDFVTCQAISSLQPSSFSFSLSFFSIPQGSPGQGADVLTCQASDRHSQQGESNSQDCPQAFDTSDLVGRSTAPLCSSGDFFLGFAVPVNTSLENVWGRRRKKKKNREGRKQEPKCHLSREELRPQL